MKLLFQYLDIKKIRFAYYVDADNNNEPVTPLIPCKVCSPTTFYRYLTSNKKTYGLFMSSPYGLVYLGILEKTMADKLCDEEVSLSDSDFTHNIHVCEIQNNHIEIIKYFPNIDTINNYYKRICEDGWIDYFLEAFK